MAKAIIDLSGRGGLAPKFFGDVNDSTGRPQLRYIGGETQFAQGTFNPIRNYGYLSPATNTYTTISESDAGTSFTNEWRATVFDSVATSFYFGENGNLVWGADFTAGGATSTNLRNSLGSAISGTDVKITDFEIYQVNATKRIFFSYQKNGGGDIGIFDPTSDGNVNSNNNTWLSGTVTGAFTTGATSDVFMRSADNGFMYIFDTSTVHRIDGTSTGSTNGVAYQNVLTFPSTINVPDAVDWRGAMYIAIQTSAPLGTSSTNATNEQVVGVYVWNRQSAVISSQDYIPMNGVREVRRLYVTPSGELRALVISSERFTQVRRYNGSTFEIMAEAGIGAYPRYRDSFGYMGGLATWYGVDGKLYCHGSISVGEKEGIYVIGDTTGTVTGSFTTGAILYADSNGSTTTPRQGLFLSAKNSTPTLFNEIWYPHGTGTIGNDAQLGNAGDAYSLVKFLPKLSTVNYINVYCIPTASATSTTCGTVTVYLNQGTSAFKTYAVPLSEASRGYVTIPIGKPYVNAIQVKISWPTNITLGTNDFCPSFAEVDYTTTDTFK